MRLGHNSNYLDTIYKILKPALEIWFWLKLSQRSIYNRRGVSIEPLIEHIKSVFRIDPLPVRGFHVVSAIVLISVLLYQIMVCYNCKVGKTNPKSIKYMLGIGWNDYRIKISNFELWSCLIYIQICFCYKLKNK